MKRNNHSVNVGEGDDFDSTISLYLLMIPDCDILRPLDGASIGHPDDGAAHWNIHGGAAGARENATESTQSMISHSERTSRARTRGGP